MPEHELSAALARAEAALDDLEAGLTGASRQYLLEHYFGGDAGAARAYLSARRSSNDRQYTHARRRRHLLSMLKLPSDGVWKHPATVDDYYPLLIRPFLTLAAADLADKIGEFGDAFEQQRWSAPLERDVAKRLNHLLTPSIVLEHHSEPSPSSSATEFVRRFFGAYPMLLRYALTIVSNAASDLALLRTRVRRDHQALRDTFGFETASMVVGEPLGDPHAGGLTVRALRCVDTVVVYKPRAIQGENVLEQACGWLSAASDNLDLPAMRCLPRTDYGYTEFISHRPLRDGELASQFYTRSGALLFVSWVLGLTDLHYENLIARGDAPIIVDAEAIFWRTFKRGAALNEFAYRDVAMHDLLLLNGLLPTRLTVGSRNVSLGGLAPESAIGKPFLTQRVESTPDGVRLRKTAVGPDDRLPNLPIRAGIQIAPHAHCEDILTGFSEARAAVTCAPNGFIAGALGRSAHAIVQRVILRETSFYGQLLTSLSHPAIAAQPREAEALLGQLFTTTEHRPEDANVAAAEAEALLARDIPYFTASESDLELHASDTSLGTWFNASGAEGVRERLASVPALQFNHQRVIQIFLDRDRASEPTLRSGPPHAPSDLQSWANHVANIVDQRRVSIGDHDFWLALESDSDRTLSIAPSDLSLYSGAGGIGIFLAALEDPRYADDIDALEQRAVNGLEHPALRSLGAVDGVCSQLYFLALAAALRGKPMPQIHSKLADLLVESLASDDRLDWISGAAGILRLSNQLYCATGDIESARVSRAAAQRLIDTADTEDQLASWNPMTVKSRLCGFAHGASGIAYALADYASCFDQPECFDVIDRAFTFVREAWARDGMYRNAQGLNGGASWCHGALGVFLAAQRVQAIKPLDSARAVMQDATSLLSRTAEFASHDLCHGAAGSIEFALARGERTEAREQLVNCLKALQRGAFQTPFLLDDGLFAGVAGIGYQCLRTLSPQRLPCLLTLDLPRLNAR